MTDNVNATCALLTDDIEQEDPEPHQVMIAIHVEVMEALRQHLHSKYGSIKSSSRIPNVVKYPQFELEDRSALLDQQSEWVPTIKTIVVYLQPNDTLVEE